LGRSRGGVTTKLHIAATDENTPVALVLTPGQRHDAAAFDALLGQLPPDCRPSIAIADKGYDSSEIRDDLRNEGMTPVIPFRTLALNPEPLNKKEYRERNRIERFVSKLKQFRRVATRYDKLAKSFLAFVHIASALIICRQFVNTA
jgi:transposase